jgi:hypothetical protein
MQLEGGGIVIFPMGAALLEFGISIAGELIGALLDLVVARQRDKFGKGHTPKKSVFLAHPLRASRIKREIKGKQPHS